MRQQPLPLGFDPLQGFEEFHAGPNTELVAHLQSLAAAGPEPFIYLWGGGAQGKTHLLNACCRDAHRRGFSCAYLPLPTLKLHGTQMLDGLDQLDLVCLDDLEEITGDPAWEQGLFSLFNGLRERGRRLLTAARQPPAQLPVALPDLKTRLEWGLTLHLAPLADADKLQALHLQARSMGLDLPPLAGRYLMAHRERDLGSLRRLLQELDRATLAAQRKLTVPFIKAYLEQRP